MLDSETKTRINNARDILVGKVPDPKSQVEQITIALIYKFMDDMDLQSEELGGGRSFFKGEFEKYAWRKIFDPRMGGFEILNLYSEAIVKMNVNPNMPQLFRDIFKNAYLPYRDPETLKAFLKIINEFTYDHSERLGDAFEYLLSVLGSQGEAGQFRTPRHIIDFMVAIIDPKKDEVILDPACGTAGFLISSYKHIIKNNSSNYDPAKDVRMFETKDLSLSEIVINSKNYKGDKLTPDERNRLANNIKGYDISPDMVRLSLVNMYLHGLHAPHIYEYDTLTSEDNWNEYADVILANPPFMSPKGGIRPHKRFSITSNRSEVLFVDYIAEHLTPNGRAAVIVPEGIIFQSGTAYKNLRKMLVENYLVGVISLPAGVFQPYSGVKTSILWIDRTLAKRKDKILFVKIENDGFDLGAQRRPINHNDLSRMIGEILEYKRTILKNSIFNPESKSLLLVEKELICNIGDYNLTAERYKPGIKLTTAFELVSLHDLVIEMHQGINTAGEKVIFETSGYPIIQARNMTNEVIDFDNIKYMSKNDWEKYKYKHKPNLGDILFSNIGTIGRSVVVKNEEDYLIHWNIFKITVQQQKILPDFLKYILGYLTSINYWDQFQKGGTVQFVNKKILNEIQIPLPPLSVQEEIVAEIESYQKIINGARQVVENYKPRIEIDPEWPMVELGSLIKINNGYVLTDFSEKGKIACIKVSDMNLEQNLYEIVTTSHWINETSRPLLPVDSIIFPKRGAAIATNKKRISRIPCLIDNNCMGLISKDFNKLIPEFLFYFMLGFDLTTISNSAGIALINNGDITSVKIPLPNVDDQKKVVERLKIERGHFNSTNELIKIFEQKIKDRIAKVWGEKKV